MSNFSKFTYLGNYIKKFREKLPLNNLSIQDLHYALNQMNIKPKNGTMYERKDIEQVLNFLPQLNNIRKILGVKPKEITTTNNNKNVKYFSPENKKEEIIPNYYNTEEMKIASDELLKNDEVFFENKIKLSETDLKTIIKECINKIIKQKRL